MQTNMYKHPRLKYVKKIKDLCAEIKERCMIITPVGGIMIRSILDQCNLLLETKKKKRKKCNCKEIGNVCFHSKPKHKLPFDKDVKFLKDNGFKSLSKALVKLDGLTITFKK